MAKIIFFGNHKGGVGKTTTTFQVGANMAKLGKKVLLIDLDPQGSLSKICVKMVNIKNTNDIPVERTLNYLLELYLLKFRRITKLDVLENSEVLKTDENTKNIVKNSIYKSETEKGFLAFIPNRIDIENSRINDLAYKMSRYSMGIVGLSVMIDDIIDSFEDGLDYVLVDCPPAINAIIESIFLKSDYFMIPTIADDISTSGVADYISNINKTFLRFTYESSVGGLLLEKVFKKQPELLGILETMYKEIESPSSSAIMSSLNDQLIEINVKEPIATKKYLRYNFNIYNPNAKANKSYILDNKIHFLNNRTTKGKEGIPFFTDKATAHEEYEQITKIILNSIGV